MTCGTQFVGDKQLIFNYSSIARITLFEFQFYNNECLYTVNL